MAKNGKNTQVYNTHAHNTHVTHEHDVHARRIVKANDAQKEYVDKYRINGIELQAILDEYGASQMEFAKSIEKSRGLVTLWVHNKYRKIPFRYAQKLEEFVGEELYVTTLENLRTKIIKREAQDVGKV